MSDTLEGVIFHGDPSAQDEVNAALTPGTALVPRRGWAPAVRTCQTCGAPLPKGRRRYCSNEHARLDPARREAVTCQWKPCGIDLPIGRRRFCSDLHAKRQRADDQRKMREADGGAEMIRAAARLLHGTSGRTGNLDVTTLGVLWGMQLDLEAAVFRTITGLRQAGFTWEEIGREMGGTSKQAAMQWYSRHERLYHPKPVLEAAPAE